ncbi:RNA polymerase sigma factor SigJ [Antrihabitans cavernicola]|uniref:Sigma-70 family RNA polymerase sigma factor n=1 Tax=Antrihabitans cavernicola TaxID=2495913 RepID=A0A5A7SA73_9NOCA|nr:RNA polymerase sigma factor SigJ [Spelaeibacter cavernicola]KAA0023050.1 sigma-70 family RNA polymerase sigma factor [Spelaeibacter cavernicola]
MSDTELADRFEELRPYLRRVAYSTLGSLAEADDVVQDAWLRLQRVDATEIDNLRGWLTTVVGRLALDSLGSARSRRETYVGSWLPEPEVTQWDDPADRISQDERVTMALLVVLETLSPAERTAFVLQDVFGLSSGEVADVVGRTPAAVRQLATRARKHVQDGSPRFPASTTEHQRAVSAFAVAWRAGDLEALLKVLGDDVTFTADGGGKVTAVARPLHGADSVSSFLLRVALTTLRSHGDQVRGGLVSVNGEPGLIIFDGKDLSVYSFVVENDHITSIDVIRNPDKLRNVAVPDESSSRWFD